MNMTRGFRIEGSGVSRVTSLRSGALVSLPMRMEVEYIVQDCGLAAGTGSTLAVVETGVELTCGALPADVVVGAELDGDEGCELLVGTVLLFVGVGVTMATAGVEAGVVGDDTTGFVDADDADGLDPPGPVELVELAPPNGS